MSEELKGRTIAILATDGFEQVELTEPKRHLEAAGAKVEILSVKQGSIKGWKVTEWGDAVPVDRLVSQANGDEYDALVLPGGQINPNKLRMEEDAVAFIKSFAQGGKPVAAICHGPWLLIEAGLVKGKTLTSWPSVQTDLRNAGAHWVDKEVVQDGNIVTSRKPEDIPAFSRKVIQLTAKAPKPAHAH